MKLAPLFAVLAFAAAPCLAADAPKDDIQKVIQVFQASLKAHDGKTLGTLFLPDGKAWITALGQESLAKVRAKHPDVPPFRNSTWQEFATFVSTAKEPIEERFHDVRIETDGTVASVYFDFEFLMDGKVGNHGAETWQMLHTPDGWKIVAMLYSSNF